MGLSELRGSVIETIVVDIDFTANQTVDTIIPINAQVREIIRGRLYIDEDPGAAFSNWSKYTFYNKSAKHGQDAFYRTDSKLLYTELEVATNGTDTNIQPDDHTDFSPNDLVYLIDGESSEFARLSTIANVMVAEDIPGVHAIDVGLVRVSEFSGFQIFNAEDGTDVYFRVEFIPSVTISLKLELLLRKYYA